MRWCGGILFVIILVLVQPVRAQTASVTHVGTSYLFSSQIPSVAGALQYVAQWSIDGVNWGAVYGQNSSYYFDTTQLVDGQHHFHAVMCAQVGANWTVAGDVDVLFSTANGTTVSGFGAANSVVPQSKYLSAPILSLFASASQTKLLKAAGFKHIELPLFSYTTASSYATWQSWYDGWMNPQLSSAKNNSLKVIATADELNVWAVTGGYGSCSWGKKAAQYAVAKFINASCVTIVGKDECDCWGASPPAKLATQTSDLLAVYKCPPLIWPVSAGANAAVSSTWNATSGIGSVFWANLTGVPQALTLAHQTTAENLQYLDQRIGLIVPTFNGKPWIGEASLVEMINGKFQLARPQNVVCEMALLVARGASGVRVYQGNNITADTTMTQALAAINGQISSRWSVLMTTRTAAPNFGNGILSDARTGLLVIINTFERPMTITIPAGYSSYTGIAGATMRQGTLGGSLTLNASEVLFVK